MVNKRSLHIGCCISPHGYGHASRASAVMQSLTFSSKVKFEIVTSIPAWFFAQSLEDVFSIHNVVTDIGMIQSTPLHENLDATIRSLDTFYPLTDAMVDGIARLFSACDLVLCDIAPLGILAARKAGVPSVLIENFTWDWIYEGYLEICPQFNTHIKYLENVYQQASCHIQAEPVCFPSVCDLTVDPVARSIKQGGKKIRQQLQVGPEMNLILLTMGGVQGESISLATLRHRDDCIFLVPGQKGDWQRQDNIWHFPVQGDIYHPDLVSATDTVIGKVGYSTLAEVYQAGIPFGYVQRPGFRESKPLADFISREMSSCEISIEALYSGDWDDSLSALLALPKNRPKRNRGAEQVANYLLSLV